MTPTKTKPAVTIGTAELMGTFKQGSPEWHAARLEVIGSSDIAAILGLSSKSEFTLFHEKVGLVAPIPPDEKLQRKFDYGHWMEPFVAGIYQKKHPEVFVQETGTWRHQERRWQGCNPDRLLSLADTPADSMTPHSALELKTFPSLLDWDYGPPPGYIAQLKWQLDVFGFKSGVISGYANLSGDYVEYEYELDPFEADAVRARAETFMHRVNEARQAIEAAGGRKAALEAPDVMAILQELAPEIDGSKGTYETLRKLNPSIPDPKAEVEVPAEIAEQYLEACAYAKWAEGDLFKWRGHMLAFMGTAKYAVYDGKRIASRVGVKDNPPYLKEA